MLVSFSRCVAVLPHPYRRREDGRVASRKKIRASVSTQVPGVKGHWREGSVTKEGGKGGERRAVEGQVASPRAMYVHRPS